MSLISSPIVCSYNGYSFNVTQVVSASMRHIPDAAGRTIVSTTLTLKVKAIVADGASQDVTLAALKTALSAQGGALVWSGAGFGGLSINTAGGTTRDLNWGPRPLLTEFEPIGRDYAAKVTWQVEVSLIGCANAPFQGRVMEATYGLKFSEDDGGYTTRVHSGLIRIPMTRTAAGAVPDSVDNYFEAWVPAALPGYRRTVNRDIDPSHAKMTFDVTDAERAGHALPAGVVNATGSHTMTSEGKYVSILWSGSISMAYELARDVPRSVAFEYFMQLCEDRVRAEYAKGASLFIPTSMTIGEPEIHGKVGAAFTLNYRLAFGNGGPGGGPVRRAFPVHGPWRGPPGATWERHSDSLANGPQHPRGLDRLQHDARTDRIVDLCGNERELRGVVMGRNVSLKNVPIDPKWAEVKRRLKIPDNPPPAATWLGYESKMVLEPHDRTAIHVPLPDGSASLSTPGASGGGTSSLRTPAAGGSPLLVPSTQSTLRTTGPLVPGLPFVLNAQVTPGAIVQPITSPGYFVRVIGRAVRYAYAIPRPQLNLPEVNDPRRGNFFSHWIAAVSTDNIFCAQWDLRYYVARPTNDGPFVLPMLPHPFMQ